MHTQTDHGFDFHFFDAPNRWFLNFLMSGVMLIYKITSLGSMIQLHAKFAVLSENKTCKDEFVRLKMLYFFYVLNGLIQ